MNVNEIKSKIEKADLIVFNIFETLLFSYYGKQTDLFWHLEESKNLPGYARARINAEQIVKDKAAQSGGQVVSLENIYQELHASYQEVKNDEIELTKQTYVSNPEMQDIYLFAQQSNKQIALVADTYLPESVMEDILQKAGMIGYTRIYYVSSQDQSADTALYDKIIQEFDMSADQILCISDSSHAGLEICNKKGIPTYRYEPIRQSIGSNLNSAYFAILNESAKAEVAPSLIQGFVTHYMGANSGADYWKQFGYKFIGPLTYAYSQWLKDRLQQCKIDNVYFATEDGYLLKRAFELFDDSCEIKELHGLSNLFFVASVTSKEELEKVLDAVYEKGITYAELWNKLGINGEELHQKYKQRFSAQDQVIISDGGLNHVTDFWKENIDLLLGEVKNARENLISYLESTGIFKSICGIVELGLEDFWVKDLMSFCKTSACSADLVGFCLAAMDCKTPNLRIESYLFERGTAPTNKQGILTDPFVTSILKLVFSDPYYHDRQTEKNEQGFMSDDHRNSISDSQNFVICNLIQQGALDFVKDVISVFQKTPLNISKATALAPLKYLAYHIQKYDRAKIEQLFCNSPNEDGWNHRPLFKTGKPVMGIINPWPGDQSAEAEVLTRFKRAAEENELEYIMLDNFGHVLDNEQHMTNALVDEERLSFVLTTHYETPKVLNAFYYHTLWNPPEIPLNLDYYTKRVTDNYIMNDDFLVYDSGGMSNHLRSMLMNCPRTLEGASSLTASFPASAMLKPSLDNPMMFYCGMNWEKVVHGTNRHEGLFKLLDNTKKVKFFGPERVEAWGGLKPWEGYACYQYSIPFDGFSILKEINACGICLVLSSDIHRRAGAATNRTYEACAAGAVIISDDNPFMLEHFKDAALFIVYNKDNPADTFRQIMEKYDWIVSHREEALALAKRAQEIFVEKFSLDIQFNKIVANHPKRVEQIEKDLFAQDCKGKVLVTHVLDTNDVSEAEKRLNRVVQNVHQQFYPNIEVAVGADFAIEEAVQSFASANGACVRVFPMEIFDQKGTRKMTNGQAIRKMQRQVDHEYYMNAGDGEVWYSDHITTLIRAIEDSGTICGYSGTSFEDDKKYRRIEFFDILNLNHLFSMKEPQQGLTPGQFLFTAKAHTMLPDYLFDCLDGREHYAYASVLHYKFGEKLAFTRRMSLCFARSEKERSFVLPIEMQNRFIQDLVRFHLPEQSNMAMMEQLNDQTPGSVPTKRSLTDMLLMIPLKSMILLRYYRFRMRRLNPKSDKYHKFDEKYSAVLRQYNEYWGN